LNDYLNITNVSSTMAANGITIKPMRMGDLVNQKDTPVVSKYLPPSRRGTQVGQTAQVIQKIDMSDKNFPTLGSTPKKMVAWGNHVVSLPSEPSVVAEVSDEAEVKKETLSDKIKEKIRLDAIAEDTKLRHIQTDIWKMTDKELELAGWVKLPMSSAKDISLRGFKRETNPYLARFYAEAPCGMSFDEYLHYLPELYNESTEKVPVYSQQEYDDSDYDE